MKNSTYIQVLILSMALAAGGSFCSKKKAPSSFNGFFKRLSQVESPREKINFYSRGTLKAIDRAVNKGYILKQSKFSLLPLFNSKTEWEETGIKTKDDEGWITIKYTHHPVENMRGYRINFHLIREDGEWRIDLEKEINDSIPKKDGNGPKRYIENIRKKYR